MKNLIENGDSRRPGEIDFFNNYLFNAAGGWNSFIKPDANGEIDQTEFNRVCVKLSHAEISRRNGIINKGSVSPDKYFNGVDMDGNGKYSAAEMKNLIDHGEYTDAEKEFLNDYFFTKTTAWASFVNYNTAGDINRAEFMKIAHEA